MQDQIESLKAKIKEKEGSTDKMDLFLVRNWKRSLQILGKIKVSN